MIYDSFFINLLIGGKPIYYSEDDFFRISCLLPAKLIEFTIPNQLNFVLIQNEHKFVLFYYFIPNLPPSGQEQYRIFTEAPT